MRVCHDGDVVWHTVVIHLRHGLAGYRHIYDAAKVSHRHSIAREHLSPRAYGELGALNLLLYVGIDDAGHGSYHILYLRAYGVELVEVIAKELDGNLRL